MKFADLDIFDGIGSIINGISDLVHGDEKRKLELYLAQLSVLRENAKGQLKVNEAEAAHRSIFVAGWRPAIGWIGVIALAFSYIIHPYIFPFLYEYYPVLKTLPVPNDNLYELVIGLLGLGGLRTFEKNKGITK